MCFKLYNRSTGSYANVFGNLNIWYVVSLYVSIEEKDWKFCF